MESNYIEINQVIEIYKEKYPASYTCISESVHLFPGEENEYILRVIKESLEESTEIYKLLSAYRNSVRSIINNSTLNSEQKLQQIARVI